MTTYTLHPDPAGCGTVAVLLLLSNPFRPWLGVHPAGAEIMFSCACHPAVPPLWRLTALAAAGRPFLGIFGPDVAGAAFELHWHGPATSSSRILRTLVRVPRAMGTRL